MSKSILKLFQFILMIGFVLSGLVACDKADNTNDEPSSEKVTDIEGNIYKTVKIGTQVWMAENLKTTKYNDGTDIPIISDSQKFSESKTGLYCYYNNIESNAVKYGLLYNWFAVNSGKLAPEGWHVPTDEEWSVLENYLIVNGFNYDGANSGNKYAKSLASTTGWTLSKVTGSPGTSPENNNSSGFTAIPGGARYLGGQFGYSGRDGEWWSSTASSEGGAYFRSLDYNLVTLNRYDNYKQSGFSVRLVKDN